MKKAILAFLAITVCATTFTSCSKDDDETPLSPEMLQTVSMAREKAIADNVTENSHDLLMEVATDEGLMGNRSTQLTTGARVLSCASVDVTPLVGFPKTITLDFGTGCTDAAGITRSGVITIVLSDSLRATGATAEMTFQNYFVQGHKLEGSINWTNTSTVNERKWTRNVVNGKITPPAGAAHWTFNSSRTIVHVAGAHTPMQFLDDEFDVTGIGSITNAANITRTDTILTALHKKFICSNIDRGTVKLTGSNHSGVLDFGDGTCDRIATLTIAGFPPRTITLP